MSERITNSFEGGMASDLDDKIKATNTYELSVNGRLIYNEDGSLSWENAKGNKYSVSNYDDRYKTVGVCEFEDVVIVFSKYTNGATTYDEIGYITFNFDGFGVYRILHNDTKDTLNKQLNFSLDHPIQAVPFKESDELIRAYFTDDFNEPRVFTFKLKDDGTFDTYEAITTSEFYMNLVPDFSMGEIEYRGLTDGSLRTGIYQYSYRLKTLDGYQTPWTPITFPIVVTGRKALENNERYGMKDVDVVGATGTVIQVNNIDTRYNEIEIAYVHTIEETGVKEAGIFYDSLINGQSQINTQHVSVENIQPIEVTELADIKDVIKKARTLQIKDNRLWFGNTEGKATFSIPDDVLDNFYVEPEFRGLPTDLYARRPYGRVSDINGFQAIKTDLGIDSMFQRSYEKHGLSDTYAVKERLIADGSNKGIEDYQNYQGSQVCHSFTGYFRGETYRFAVVFFDKKGYPFFAKHLADVRMPHNTHGIYQSDINDLYGGGDAEVRNYLNKLTATRVKDDGTTQYKEVEVGHMGAIPTETNADYSAEALVTSDGDRRLFGQSLLRHGGQASVESKYHIAHNAPVNALNVYRATDLPFNNPNDIGTVSQKTVTNQYPSNDVGFTRIMGLRFGGIDLSVEIDGTPLYDLISGLMIVRADRVGADEQIKDTGIVVNCQDAGSNVDGKKKAWVHSNPVLGGANASKNKTSFCSRDDGGDVVKTVDLSPHVYTFDGVNHKISGEAPQFKAGLSKLRVEYICDVSNPFFSSNADEGYRALATQAIQERHYISKNLNTYNTRVLTQDVNNRWIRGNKLTDITKIGEITNGGNNYGYFDDYLVGTEAWVGLIQGDNLPVDSLDFDTAYKGGGGGTGSAIDDDRWYRGRYNSDSLLLTAATPYLSAFGQIQGSGGSVDLNQHLSFYVASIVEPNSSPYGGAKLETVQNTRFHTTGHFLAITDQLKDDIKNGGYLLNEMEVWGGDCYLDLFSFARVYPTIEFDGSCIPQALGNGNQYRDWSHAIVFPVESKYNYRLTYKDEANGVPVWSSTGTASGATIAGDSGEPNYNSYAISGLHESTQETCPDKLENFQYQLALNYSDRVRSFAPKPVDYVEITDNPTRWHWSNNKLTRNAKVDVFRQFEELSNFDLDSNHGEIAGNALLFDYIYSVQERAVGRLRISERAILSDPNAGNLLLGEGGIMDGIQYISTTFGTQHRDSVVSSDRNFYFVDAKMRKILRFGQDGLDYLSDSKGIHTFIEPYLDLLSKPNTDRITNGIGIVAAFDYGNNDVIFTIKDGINGNISEYKKGGSPNLSRFSGALTVAYNELLSAIHGTFTFYPSVYFRNGSRLYSNNNDGKGNLYLYNEGQRGVYFDEDYYSVLKLNINEYGSLVKKFDNSIWNVNEDALANIEEVYAETEGVRHTYSVLSDEIVNVSGYQNNVLGNNRAKYRQGLLRFPLRERSSGKPRLSGKSSEMQLKIDNSVGNNKFSLTSIDTLVRLHSRK
jgi:hypothetical protein